MTRDLDLNDLDEVRRRVVDPVLAWMLRPGELVAAELVVAQDWPDTDNEDWAWKRWPNNPEADRPGDAPNSLYLVVRAVGDEEQTAQLGTLGFSLHDAADVAERLASTLADWICETRFGWADLRDWRGLEIPEPPRDPLGRPVVGLWAVPETADLTIDGNPAVASVLRLSDGLVADLRRWQERGREWAEAEEAEQQRRYEAAMASSASGFKVSYLDASKAAEELAAVRQAREQAHLGRWRQFVAEMEPWRDELLTRLQSELGDAHRVPLPARTL